MSLLNLTLIFLTAYPWPMKNSSGNFLWKHKEAWAPDPGPRRWNWDVPIFRELEIEGNKVFIIGKEGWDWDSSTLFAFDGKTGNLLKEIEYPREKITFGETAGDLSIINISKSSVSIIK